MGSQSSSTRVPEAIHQQQYTTSAAAHQQQYPTSAAVHYISSSTSAVLTGKRTVHEPWHACKACSYSSSTRQNKQNKLLRCDNCKMAATMKRSNTATKWITWFWVLLTLLLDLMSGTCCHHTLCLPKTTRILFHIAFYDGLRCGAFGSMAYHKS